MDFHFLCYFVFLSLKFVYNSISKLNNSRYLSGTFQLKASCFKVGLQCLFPHVFPMLAVFTPDMGPSSGSPSAMAAWIATCVTTDWILTPPFHLDFLIFVSNGVTCCLSETFTPDTIQCYEPQM